MVESHQAHFTTMNKPPKHKTGLAFEELIAWIQQCVHQRAKIEANTKVRDVDTGKLRQIDISLRLTDGPTEFFAIVEVRDRSRLIGVSYVEEMADKRRSVAADAVFLVSRSGFTQTALTKAEKLGIRTLTYDEATKEDWSGWLRCQTLSVSNRKYEKAKIFFAEVGSNQIITISPETLRAFKNDKSTKILRTEDGSPTLSLPNLVQNIVNYFTDQLFEGIPLDGTRQRKVILVGENQVQPALSIESSDGKLSKIGKIKLELDCYCEISNYPFRLMKYREPSATQSIAEIAAAEIEISKGKVRVELLAPGAGAYIPAGSNFSIRITKLS